MRCTRCNAIIGAVKVTFRIPLSFPPRYEELCRACAGHGR